MRAIALCYHDVDGPKGAGRSLPHPSPLYCLSSSQFRSHLDSIQDACGQQAVRVFAGRPDWAEALPVLLTFDDGGRGAIDTIAPELEIRGWRGFFFVTTDWIGVEGYLSAEEIRELLSRGHVIGSHSCSHPERMAALPARQIAREWTESRSRLEDLTGSAILTASVPGGYFSSRVAACAAEAGFEVLFNSEPRATVAPGEGCLTIGRFAVQRSTAASTVGRLASGRIGPRLSQAVSWGAKKLVKTTAGPYYLSLRRCLLSLRPDGAQGVKS